MSLHFNDGGADRARAHFLTVVSRSPWPTTSDLSPSSSRSSSPGGRRQRPPHEYRYTSRGQFANMLEKRAKDLADLAERLKEHGGLMRAQNGVGDAIDDLNRGRGEVARGDAAANEHRQTTDDLFAFRGTLGRYRI